jgi:hypothetical protein
MLQKIILFILLVISFGCRSEMQYPMNKGNDYLGVWIPISYKFCEIIGSNKNEISTMMKSTISIKESFIVFLNDTIYKPTYIFDSTRLDEALICNISSQEIGISGDSIYRLNVAFPAEDPNPPIDFIISKPFLIVELDGVIYYLKRKNKFETIPVYGDTVRCKYREKGGVCTGFVIQGSRVTGKAIHVTPKNNKVPLEIDNRDIK